MRELVRTDEFRYWFDTLKDKKLQKIIITRLTRLAFDNVGDVKPVGNGISELRIHYGAGYRIYYINSTKEIIILLCGGDKSTQQKDIENAKRILQGVK